MVSNEVPGRTVGSLLSMGIIRHKVLRTDIWICIEDGCRPPALLEHDVGGKGALGR